MYPKIKELMEKGNLDDKVVDTFYILMKECHQQFSEIMKMPIPLVDEIMKRVEREQKELKRRMKK